MPCREYPIDIQRVLDATSVRHSIIKKSIIFPDYVDGQDVDIYCDNAPELSSQIVYLTKSIIDEGYTIQVSKTDKHIHVDIKKDGIILRFDLIDSLDVYRDEIMTDNIYAHMAVRLLEYSKYPTKEKHLDYVKSHLL